MGFLFLRGISTHSLTHLTPPSRSLSLYSLSISSLPLSLSLSLSLHTYLISPITPISYNSYLLSAFSYDSYLLSLLSLSWNSYTQHSSSLLPILQYIPHRTPVSPFSLVFYSISGSPEWLCSRVWKIVLGRQDLSLCTVFPLTLHVSRVPILQYVPRRTPVSPFPSYFTVYLALQSGSAVGCGK